MLYIHFIVNPISGNGKHNIGLTMLERYFPKDQFKIAVDYSKYKKHAVSLTQEAVLQKPDYIVACGGDGTINEVASCLVNTNIKLGIIPVGSGNGLASNLKIPRKIEAAIAIIQKGISSSIDVGKINEKYFFSNMGIGIDARIIKKYEASRKRTLLAYVKATLSASMEFKPIQSIITFDDHQPINLNLFLLFISNSNEMGYGMSLTPNANLDDGLLDLVTVSKLSFVEKLLLGFYVLTNKVEKFKKANHSLIKKVTIEMPKKIFVDAQIDGEYHNLKTNIIDVSIIKSGLKVITN